MEPFGEEHAARYDQAFANLAPWAEAMRLATQFALAELPPESHLLCVGAGTGAEIEHLAQIYPRWRFTALDPSGPMLDRCRTRLSRAGLSNRCAYHQGYIDTFAPEGAFDGATSLLVSQFIVERERRVDFFSRIRRHVRSDAPLVTADLSFGPKAHEGRLVALWQHAWRYAGIAEERVQAFGEGKLEDMLSIVASEDFAAILTEAGWQAPTQVFQAVMMHAWAARAGGDGMSP